MGKISIEDRKKIILKLKNKKSQRNVSETFEISRCAIQTLLKKYSISGNVKNMSRKGRPKKLSVRDERILIRQSKINPKQTASQLRNSCQMENLISISTVKRHLQKSGLFGRIGVKKPFLNKKQIKKSFTVGNIIFFFE